MPHVHPATVAAQTAMFDQLARGRRSMELLATDVMPRFSRHADTTPAR
jgi:alkanesulfonate monooxygenase SsuD/methylene tetrahydromethanopterin reductase-like flavin-dependent oxidoreductase (luciferase family)